MQQAIYCKYKRKPNTTDNFGAMDHRSVSDTNKLCGFAIGATTSLFLENILG